MLAPLVPRRARRASWARRARLGMSRSILEYRVYKNLRKYSFKVFLWCIGFPKANQRKVILEKHFLLVSWEFDIRLNTPATESWKGRWIFLLSSLVYVKGFEIEPVRGFRPSQSWD